jgi:hypothetical protein
MTITREDLRFWDNRTLERRIRKGQLNRKDVDKHLKSLPDVADKGQAPMIEAVAAVEDIYEDEDETDDVGSNGVSEGDSDPSEE